MESNNLPKEKGKVQKTKINNILKNIKSKTILRKIILLFQYRKLLAIINYNKEFQNKLNINIDDYKDYYEKHSAIEIEIIPDIYGKFINIPKEEESYYHIYFNDDKDEIKRNYTERKEIIKIIKIIIDDQVESFSKLFEDCRCIKSINFKKFISLISRGGLYN